MKEPHQFPPPIRTQMIEQSVYTCQRCGYEFTAQRLPPGRIPAICKNPKCRSKDWQQPYANPEQSEIMRQWHASRRHSHPDNTCPHPSS